MVGGGVFGERGRRAAGFPGDGRAPRRGAAAGGIGGEWRASGGSGGRTNFDAAIDAALGVLEQPLTRTEIAERVCRALGVQAQALHGGGWGSRRKVPAVPVGEIVFPVVDLLHLAAARGAVCYGPNRDGEPSFVRADAWIPGWQDIPAEEAEAALLRKCDSAMIDRLIADLAPEFREVIVLREFEDMSYREIAALVGVPVGTVMSRLARARDLLRRGYAVCIGKVGDLEVDFVAWREDRVEYFQVSYLLADPVTVEQEFRSLEAIADNHPKTVLSMDEFDLSRNGIRHRHLPSWLLSP